MLTDEERATGYTRPVRRVYLHLSCGQFSRIPLDLGQQLARDPHCRLVTFCCHCNEMRPVAEFRWKDGAAVGD